MQLKKLSKDSFLNADKIFPLEFDENDLKNIFLQPKKNFNGIGYKGLRTNVNFCDQNLEQQSNAEFSTTMKDGKKLKITGEAFGYGAMDDEEDDAYETEIYSFDDLSKYDYSLGSKQQANKASGQLFNAILSDSHLMDDFSKSAEGDFYSSNSNKMNENKNSINVPSNWKAKPPIRTKKIRSKSRWSSEVEDSDNLKKEENKEDKFKAKPPLNAIQRAEMLDEDVDSLEREAIEIKLNKVKEEQVKKQSIEEQLIIKPATTTEDRFKKPLTGFFANKFTQSTNTPLDDLRPGLTKIENLPQATSKKEQIEEETKSFVGKSKREIYQWHPHKLVCKRFNIAHPYPAFPEVVGVLAMNKIKQNTPLDPFLTTRTIPVQSSSNRSSNQESAEIKAEHVTEVIEEFKRPDLNLFKAVFDLSDDNEEADLSDLEEIKEVDDNLKDKTKNESDPPRILFNKSFVKKSVDDSKELEVKKRTKLSVNLFENDDLDIEEEGVNLLELKEKKSIKETGSHFLKEKDNSIKNKDYLVKDEIELKMEETSKRSIDKSDSDSDKLDDFVNEIIKPEASGLHTSSHKKKRKKHKEHKKHKKKKYKKSSKED